ncbi:hypothetical protein SEA_MOLIVIA_14 [Arthrobacter phage Molivia]|uniref:Uncharacterized protein n=1 Tax=Arthrobacter phage Molivia TaxID=2015839 RepID=A0A286N4D6_9CAUD|nr:hypothetical protein FDI28_gp14 [Arthrobacter phage Molivia]ASX99243.1 hypothetical protein SEA_MOLIVIA_14 [Arthrobacter phage Molivia]
MCAMPNCGKIAHDASGLWHIVKGVGLAFPFGWAHKVKLDRWINEDWLMFSYEFSWVICGEHYNDSLYHDKQNIHMIDVDSFWDFVRGRP